MSKIVLLVDDSAIQVASRQAILKRAGFDTQVVRSPQSALTLLKAAIARKAFGLIVSDHLMAGATGADFVRKLRDFDKQTPVIVISGVADAEGEYKDLGVTFRTKPLPPSELIALVTNALKNAA